MLEGVVAGIDVDIKADLPLQRCAQNTPPFFDLRLIATQISAGAGDPESAFVQANIAAPRTTKGWSTSAATGAVNAMLNAPIKIRCISFITLRCLRKWLGSMAVLGLTGAGMLDN